MYGGTPLDAEQLGNAVTIASTGRLMGVPERGQVVALCTALQESSLRNIDYGDQAGPDSRGLFQQRSRYWGTLEERMDPVAASQWFYRALVRIPGWWLLPVTVAAQKVQNSAYPNAYAKWQTTAEAIIAKLA